ncbi:uncharacterized protein LOC119417301 [Nematolebias whitei]|uniref:uncharacterized protein LOC119417301 n=1 Tax=Nematolebias whitei TaxID=451745 RepID=UPI001898D166|nr:uncharacterized protein LOC119417301 [Nematolebias whitei]
MNLDSVEESIQSLLSALYPPYEATAPVLLSQLFQILDSHYQRDALRCFLDFLVPAKHILDTVQQAACAQYSNVLFLCEGWPLCLHDQVVVHLAPIDSFLLQPGDFYLQVVPFCSQSARIVVCSLLEEEGLNVQVAEEIPIPETSYPCIFSRDWLNELNQDRRGTPLRQCLVATEQGLVRLPWEQVAVPDFVPQSVESSMASSPRSYPPLPPPLPVPPPLPKFTDNCPTNNYFPSSSRRTEQEECPVTIENPVLISPSPPSAFSVETRICPAKHGIAVSLCLVDTRTASSTRLVKVKGAETEGKPVGWVSPSTWDSRFTGTQTAAKSNSVSDKHIPSGLTECKVEKAGAIVSENSLLDKGKETKIHNMSKYELTANAVAQGEYIDILQAKMLFGKDQPLEKPCTPCMVRRQGGQVARAQDLKCRYRDSYQAAIQNPVAFGTERSRGNILAVVDEDAVVDTSEKCELVIVEGQNVRRKESTHTSAEIPQLHVVKCKNSTAFGLVSPKINRRKKVIPAGEQPGPTSVTSGNDHQTEKLSPTDSTKAETQRVRQPRPHHLSLGSPDPKKHPLYLGAASLTGCKDRMGRAIVELYGDHHGWRSTVTSQELFQMLLYFYSITRKEIREAGMTLIFDARRKNPQPQLYKALMALQEQCPCAVSSFVLLVDKDNRQPERCPGIQTDLVTSIKALLKLVEANQLSSGVGGSSDGRCGWMELHQRLFPFVIDLHEASCLLLRAISKLEEPQMTDTVQTVQQRMMDQKTLMRDVLDDSRLVKLQREGGAVLARLRKESDLKYPHCEDLSDAVDSVSSLYNHVEEQAHVLVQRTNVSLEHLEYLLQLREMEGLFYQIQQWFSAEGECHLLEAASIQSSGDRMEQVLNSFTGFLIEANDRRHHAMSLVSEAERLQQSGLSFPETETFRAFVCTFKSSLEDFLCRAEARGRELQIMVNVCDFCEQATELAGECTDFFTQSRSRIHTIQDLQSASQANQTNTCPDKFQEIKTLASTLPDSRGIQVWNAAYLKCQEAQELLHERMQVLDDVCHQQPVSSSCCEGHYVDVISTNVQTASPGGQMLVVQSTPGFRHPQWEEVVSGAADLGKRRPILDSKTPHSTTVACCNIIIKPEDSSDAGASQESKVTPHSPHRSTRKTDREARRRQTSRARSERDAAALSQSHTVGCQWFPWKRGPGVRSVSQDSCAPRVAAAGSSPEQQPRPLSSCSHHSQPSSRILQEAQKFQISRHGSFCSDEESCMSDRGAAGGIGTVCCKHSSLPTERYGGAFYLSSSPENTNSALRLQRIMDELVLTEREYVRSLGYILSHYLPLMDRLDIPQDLRGKRGVIFGNLEKLYDFHSHYFLLELEASERQPGMVARCFLRHSGSFGLYALYSKNKPQSDALILHHRHDIFKKKQQELGDMMDLSSYLLRPIQRISKYSLLLQDMLALVSSRASRDRTHDTVERADIQAAADLIQFQMRHGNDLLTMDAIQDCDVNLKEQGQLIRQDEFTVFFRKKKCVRRLFLFEHLILFSKPKGTNVGNDVYVYKQSLKTNDVGMTQNSCMGSLCFEIWIRRRKHEDTYTLKASSLEVKKAWTTDLERILWDQAAHSRELRLQERVFMGMGREPFMDIQPSDAAICDRAVGCVLPGRGKKGLEYPRPRSIGSGSTTSTTLSQSSSSSGRGSLPPAGYPGNPSQ